MRPILTIRVAWSVGLSVMVVSLARTAEPIETPFGMLSRVRWGAHWRHLANTNEPSMCGGDAVLCQITLTTCFILHMVYQVVLAAAMQLRLLLWLYINIQSGPKNLATDD